MSELKPEDFLNLYSGFQAPINTLDCGKKCSPHNERGVPFCCDIRHAVPTAYDPEWEYLEKHTNLWHLWEIDDPEETERLKEETPEGMVLIECLGYKLCQRNFRAISCRAFPFFPYVDSAGKFIGLSYYWDYEDVCWVISNLHVVTPGYRAQFIGTFEQIFERIPGELDSYKYHAETMRDVYNKKRKAIPLLHRNGYAYKITTHNERMRRVPVENLPKYGPYKLAARMPFPDETE